VCEHAFPVLQEMNIPATLFVSPKVISEESNYWFQELSYLRNHLSDNVVKEMICETLEVDYEQIKTYRVLYLFKCMKLKDIFQVISAIKEKYGITIDKKFNLTKDQLLELNNSNLITIGAHTMNHPILYNETDDDSEKEIQESIKKLFNMLNKDIKYFAYPNGSIGLDFGVREQLILQKNKIKLAFSTNNDFFDKKTNPLNIPRFGFSGLKIENSAYIFGKLFIVPIWHNILDIRFLGKTERRERKEIKNFSIFKYP
jgi:peptidoglycan/xylan/chitin deacetylase (PgdA/CDA1 family)